MYKYFIPGLLLIVSSLISANTLAEAGQTAAQAQSKESSAKAATQIQRKESTAKGANQVQRKKPSAKGASKAQRKSSKSKRSTKVQRKKSSAKVATQLQSNESSANIKTQTPSYEYSTKLTTQLPKYVPPTPVVPQIPAFEQPAIPAIKMVAPIPSYEPSAKVTQGYMSSAKVEAPVVKDLSGFDARGLWQNPKTKLIWSRCSLGQEWTGRECTGIPERLNWKQAHDAAKSYAFDGQQDWRLPTLKELLSLKLLNAGDPESADTPWFYKPDATDGYGWYWSSKPYGYLFSNFAWVVDLDIGKGEFIDQKRVARIFLVREPK